MRHIAQSRKHGAHPLSHSGLASLTRSIADSVFQFRSHFCRGESNMSRKLPLPLALMLCATPVAAQTTNCIRTGNMVNCNTFGGLLLAQPPAPPVVQPYQPPALDFSILQQAIQLRVLREQQRREAEAADEARVQAQQQNDRADLSRAVHETVGDDLKAGHCDEAVSDALKYGEIDLANQAKQFCAQPTHR